MDLVMVRVNSNPAYNYIYTAEQAHYNALKVCFHNALQMDALSKVNID